MAVLQNILSLFGTQVHSEPENVEPAEPTTYSLHPLTADDLNEVLRLNLRCFQNGENYTRHTFAFLLSEPGTLSYKAVSADGQMTAFAFVMVNADAIGHLTTIGVAPEHRRRGLAQRLLTSLEEKLRAKHISTIVLEVRVGNIAAQQLYRQLGYEVTQRIAAYYNNGEDGFLMMKSLVDIGDQNYPA